MPDRRPPMPREVWVSRAPGPMEFLTWDVEPLLPKGEPPATKYVQAEVADKMLAALKSAVESIQMLVKIGRIPANNSGLRDALAAIAHAEDRSHA